MADSPNTTTLSRRATLKRMASTAAALPLAAAGLATANASSAADADLFRVIEEFARIAGRITAAHRRSSEQHDVYESLEPPVPEALKIRSSDQVLGIVPSKVCEHEGHYCQLTADGLRKWGPTANRYTVWDADGKEIPLPLTDEVAAKGFRFQMDETPRTVEALARSWEIISAWDEWHAQCKALEESTGLKATDEEKDRLYDRLKVVEHEIWTTPAATIEGAIAKAFVVFWCHGGVIDDDDLEDSTTDYQVSVSLARDIANMASAVPAYILQVRENEAWELARIRKRKAEG